MRTQVQKFAPKGFYCLQGNSAANCLFFEDAADQKLFLTLFQRFLGKLVSLHFYSTNSTGWTLCFSTKGESIIRKVFWAYKNRNKKRKPKLQDDIDAGMMLSEHFRYFLSAYVKQSNFRHGRKGVRVRAKMKKYIFENLECMMEEVANMKAMRESEVQKAKYRPDMRYYLVEKQLKRDSVLRHSFVGLGGEKLVQMVVPCYREYPNNCVNLIVFILLHC